MPWFPLWSSHASIKGLAGVRPFERLGEDRIEILNKFHQLHVKVFCKDEARTLEKSSCEYRKPDFDLVEPRTVSWCIHESDSV
jgi:hypothetical protein